MPLIYDFASTPDAPTQWGGLDGYPPYIFRADPDISLSPLTLPHDPATGMLYDGDGNLLTHEAAANEDYAFTAMQHLMMRAMQDGYSEIGQQFPVVSEVGFDMTWGMSLAGNNGREWMAVVVQPGDTAIPNPVGPDYAAVVAGRTDPPVLPPPGSFYIRSQQYNGIVGYKVQYINADGSATTLASEHAGQWDAQFENTAAAQAYRDANLAAQGEQQVRQMHRLILDTLTGTLQLEVEGHVLWSVSADLNAYVDAGVSVMLMSVNYNAAKDGQSLPGWAWHNDDITFWHVDAPPDEVPDEEEEPPPPDEEPPPDPDPVVVGTQVWSRDVLDDGTTTEAEWR